MEMNGEDARLIEEQARQNDEEQEKLALAYGEVARTGAGQFILKDLAQRCNFRNSCIRNVNAPNPFAVVFQEGKRAVFNHIMFYVRHDNERRKARK
jgi:hypothetical protein